MPMLLIGRPLGEVQCGFVTGGETTCWCVLSMHNMSDISH